jgi:hypothetical protein
MKNLSQSDINSDWATAWEQLASAGRERGRRDTEAPLDVAAMARSFDTVYEDHFPFVWRTLRMLGVRQAAYET